MTRKKPKYQIGTYEITTNAFQFQRNFADFSCQYHSSSMEVFSALLFSNPEGNLHWPQTFYQLQNSIDIEAQDYLIGTCIYEDKYKLPIESRDQICEITLLFYMKQDDKIPLETCENNGFPDIADEYLPVDINIPKTLFDINSIYPNKTPDEWAIMNRNISSLIFESNVDHANISESNTDHANTLYLTYTNINNYQEIVVLIHSHKLLFILLIWILLLIVGLFILLIVILRTRKYKIYISTNKKRTTAITIGGETGSLSGWLTKRRFQQYGDDGNTIENEPLTTKHRWTSDSEESDLSETEVHNSTDFRNVKLDIAIVDSGTNRVVTLIKYDTGSFQKQITFSTGLGSAPNAVAVADLNNDGWLDFVAVNSGSGNVGVFLGLSNGTFSNQTIYSTGMRSFPVAISIVDLNNDSYLDMVVANFYTNNVGIFLGYGNGTFTNQTTFYTGYNSGPCGVVCGDFNNDSQLDIAVALQTSGQMGVFLGHGNGTFSPIVIYSIDSKAQPVSVATGDFNNDNRLDIVVSNFGLGSISIFYGNGDGTFSNLTNYTTGSNSQPACVVVSDLNNDAILDIAVANLGADNIGVFFGNMNHSFYDQITFSTGIGSAPTALAIEDFNNDNQLDIAFANYGSNYLGVLLQCINGTFFDPLTYSTGNNSQPYFLAVGDFNNDKRLDIVVANSNTDNIGMFFGYVNEGFLNAPAYSTGFSSQVTSIAVGDFNNDTRLDVVITNNATNNVKVIFGSGYGTFLYDITYSTGNASQPCSVSVADLNNDNRLDFVVANSGINTISIFLSNGTGTFSNQITYSTGVSSQPYSVVILDFNNDTRLDIAVASYGTSHIGVYFGYGNGSFMNQQIFSSGFNSHPFALAVGDIDNNNLTDIIATNDGYGNIDVLMKTC
ncbi:unnamed protein product [Adineta steineri]|uniref:Uncharacterized protein n=1 Tax=Adineta steineri TaxID=433720 RepID=A0A814T5R0_9BILA|nr:unnamed protein product [Adineta steineri]